MATITIKDLNTNRDLDRKAMAGISGGGAGWVYGWIQSYSRQAGSFGSTVNFFQTNYYIADQMNNQFQNTSVNAEGTNVQVHVAPTQVAGNFQAV